MSTMKRFFTICIAALLAAASFAQVNVWRRNGYLSQFDKATLDSITLTMADPYDEYNRYYDEYIDYYGIEYFSNDFGDISDEPAHLSVQAAYDYQKKLYVGLRSEGWFRHSDFGFASVCMFLDSRGQDFIGPNNGYNWFSVWGDPAHWRDTWTQTSTLTTAGLADYQIWNTCYKTIGACNYVIATHTSGSEADQYEVAQAKAMRAFEYMQLAQAYQVAYSDNSLSLPCVPLVTEPLLQYMVLAQPVATVAQVYAQIKKDLDDAISGLQGFQRADKSAINRAVAFGLRARYNLWTHHYEQAASDAEQALLLSGATPLTIAQASVPGFTSAEVQNVLWANVITESDEVVQSVYANWVSHMSTFYLDGYTNYAVPRSIASALYDEIPATDVRKGWWLDANGESPLLDAEGYSELKSSLSFKEPYVNVKFGTGDGTGNGYGAGAGDWIIMRAEELILLRAEALTRAGKNGAAVLKDFMKNYRDPSYDIDAHGLSEADEIWWQRRVELWGEGFAFGDLMRLHKGVVRTTSTNWPDAWAQDVPAGDERFPLALPEKDPKYKVLAVWQNGVNNLYKSYYTTLSNVDSITLGEAKEINDVQFYGCEARNGINRIYTSNFSQPLQRSVKEEEMATHPDTLTISFYRNHNRREAITVPLIVEADEAFANTNFPSEISLCGYNDTTCSSSYYAEIQIVVSNMPLGTHQFTITIPDEYAQGITDAKSFTYEITVREPDEWDEAEIKQGVWVDDAGLCSTFGLEAGLSWIVNYKSLEQPDGTRQIRILNPFKTIATAEDPETGLPNGYPYAEEFTINKGDYNFSLDLLANGTALFANDALLGLAYSGYGDMIIVNMKAASAGAYDKEAGKATFDAATKFYAFGFYDATSSDPYNLYSYAGFRFYESKEAWLADQPEPEEPADADVNTYVGNWTIKGLDINEESEVPVSANVTVTSYVSEKSGQYYAIEGLYPNMPVCYGTFDEETHKFKIEATQGDPVEIGGVTYIPVLYMVDANWGLSSNITLDIVPGEGGTLVTDEESAAVGFIIVYFDAADTSQRMYGEGMFDISFEPANAGAPVRKAAGIPAKVAKRNGKQSIPAREMIVKRPAKELVKKNIRLLNSNKEFQKNE